MENHLKTLELEHREGWTNKIMMMKTTGMMTGEEAGMIRLQQIKEAGMRNLQTRREQKKRIGYLAY